MLRWTLSRLAAAAAGFERVGAGDANQQTAALKRLVEAHEKGVAQSTQHRPRTLTNPYNTEDGALFFDRFNLAVLPAVSGGAVRQALRQKLVASHAVTGVQEAVVQPWQSAGERRVAVFGCRSIDYLRRQLETDATHSYLVIDASLKDLVAAAAALTPAFAGRVFFLRCEAMFSCLEVLPSACTDVAVVPMPVPFWSRQGSYRRLVHFDFLCAVHRQLTVREAPTDPRGLVLFTDCEPYAAFMMEHLEEAKLLVPYTRKNPQQTFRRWLPLDARVEETTPEKQPRERREFPKQREKEVVALAAAKSGPTPPGAVQLLAAYSYARKYYRDFAAEPSAS